MDGIGTRIKRIRLENKMTQVEFSRMICTSQPHISAIENNKEKPSKAIVKLICLLFNVNEIWLLDGQN